MRNVGQWCNQHGSQLPFYAFITKVSRVSRDLQAWSKNKFGNVPKRLQELRGRVRGLYKSLPRNGVLE